MHHNLNVWPKGEASSQPVPAEYLGVWRRSLLKTKGGTNDTSSQVYWLQTEHLHCDLRVPTAAGQIVQALRHCSDAEHLALAAQYAFAGRTEVKGDIATWYREIDFEPPGKPDVGRMTFVTPDILHEDDPDASSAAYHETWERVSGTSEPAQCWGFRLAASEEGSQRKGFLLVAGDRFMFAADRVRALPAGAGSMREIMGSSRALKEKAELLGFEVSYGSTRAWVIELSTLPQQRGATLLRGEANSFLSEKLASVLKAGASVRMGAIMPQDGWRVSLPQGKHAKP